MLKLAMICWRSIVCPIGLVLLLVLPAFGAPLTARTTLDFDQTMAEIKLGLVEQGYKIAHIQKCDGALERLDYDSDFYRVILFGEIEQVRSITNEYPELANLFPMRITVFAAGSETVISAVNPLDLFKIVDNERLAPLFTQWQQDITQLFDRVREQGSGWSD